jgi:hypothetical protein
MQSVKHEVQQRNTIPLVEPRYCDVIVRKYEVIGRHEFNSVLAQISGRQVKTSFSSDYLYFLRGLFQLYSSQGDQLVRNRRGSFIAHQRTIQKRKYAWLQIISRDEVFGRFFQFTIEPKHKGKIVQKFNSASGRYLIRWGRWLGKTLYIPKLEAYQSFEETEIPMQEEFWRMITDAYEHLSQESWIGARRYNVAVGELRGEVCARHSMLPLTFDCLLADLHRSRAHYTELELVGLPPHRLKQRTEGAKLDPITVDNVEYFYIILHAQSDKESRR